MSAEGDKAKRPDLYIGLVCAAGTDLTEIKNQLEAQLSVVGYSYKPIKVSLLISSLLEIPSCSDEFVRIKKLMEAGDEIRLKSENGHGVAAAVVTELRRIRGDDDDTPSSTAFVIDSFKNPAEIELFDKVYSKNYYTISVHLPRDERIDNLTNKIAKGRHEPPEDEHRLLARGLVEDDEKGIDKKSQNVRDTFPKADYFINAKEDISSQVKRFVELIFGEPFSTPSLDEYFMYVAKATALRSDDLSRQVGAVIADDHGAIVSTGCNEVPYPGGGFYFDGRKGKIGDNRDYVKQLDPNYIEIQRTLIELIGVLKKAKLVSDTEKDSDVVDRLLHGEYKELMSNARIRNLIEFGRVVHAEMHALSQAAAAGRAVRGTSLYCTTFPCHGCARHIISAGIRDVIYIEPYPKSLTQQLYSDEIEVAHRTAETEADDKSIDRVIFRAFHGVAPTLYQRVFAYRQRKDALGTIAEWQPRSAVPLGAAFGVERPKMEAAVSNSVAAIMEAIKVIKPPTNQETADAGESADCADSKGSTIVQ
ncbi:MAG TPA: anti-phage dCTP deaminase [Sphingomonas sp.]|jgi:cytidine deaminase